jgi:hypothetical protein
VWGRRASERKRGVERKVFRFSSTRKDENCARVREKREISSMMAGKIEESDKEIFLGEFMMEINV